MATIFLLALHHTSAYQHQPHSSGAYSVIPFLSNIAQIAHRMCHYPEHSQCFGEWIWIYLDIYCVFYRLLRSECNELVDCAEATAEWTVVEYQTIIYFPWHVFTCLFPKGGFTCNFPTLWSHSICPDLWRQRVACNLRFSTLLLEIGSDPILQPGVGTNGHGASVAETSSLNQHFTQSSENFSKSSFSSFVFPWLFSHLWSSSAGCVLVSINHPARCYLIIYFSLKYT